MTLTLAGRLHSYTILLDSLPLLKGACCPRSESASGHPLILSV